MTRLRIDLAYDGGGFYGWAKQPNLRTVQGTIEDALHKVLRVPTDDAAEPLRLTVAGRTDTGVHASHQVAHLDVSDEVLNRCVGHMTIPVTEALTRRLKAVLPSHRHSWHCRSSGRLRCQVLRIGAHLCVSGRRSFV